jgi:ankyrin repeat protein
MATEMAAAAAGGAAADGDLAAQLYILLCRLGKNSPAAPGDGGTTTAAASPAAAASTAGLGDDGEAAVAMQQPHAHEVRRLVAQATVGQLRAPSAWTERTWRPAAPSGIATAGDEQSSPPPPSRQYLADGRPVVSEAEAPFATRGLSAVHVLARYCTNAATVRSAVCTAGTDALSQSGGCDTAGSPVNATPMHYAALSNPSAEVVRCLVELGGVEQLRATDKNGAVPMHCAAESNPSAEVVRCLVELGGVEQLRATTKNGAVPMHSAALSNPSAEVVRCLVELGGVEQLRATNKYGFVPMHGAALSNPSAEVVRCLVELGGVEQLRATAKDGAVPMHCAALSNPSAEVVRCLVELGGVEQLRATAKNGAVPIHGAAESNPSAEVVQYLLGRGCNRNPRTHNGVTPLQVAISYNKEEQVAMALVEAGAEMAGVHLSASLQRVSANVSVASVLSSYFADNVTPLMAAVRAPAIILCALLPCIHAWPALR